MHERRRTSTSPTVFFVLLAATAASAPAWATAPFYATDFESGTAGWDLEGVWRPDCPGYASARGLVAAETCDGGAPGFAVGYLVSPSVPVPGGRVVVGWMDAYEGAGDDTRRIGVQFNGTGPFVVHRVAHGGSHAWEAQRMLVDAPAGASLRVLFSFARWSEAQAGTRWHVDDVVIEPPRPPGPPTDVAAAPGPRKGLQITWSPPEDGGGSAVHGYVIDDGRSVLHYEGPTSYVDEDVPPGATRTYTVAAVSGDGVGPAVAVTATAHDVPSAPVLTARPGAERGQIELRWTHGPDEGYPLDAFDVYRVDDGARSLVATLAPDRRHATVHGFEPFVTATFVVDARDRIGATSSDEACTKPAPWVHTGLECLLPPRVGT